MSAENQAILTMGSADPADGLFVWIPCRDRGQGDGQ